MSYRPVLDKENMISWTGINADDITTPFTGRRLFQTLEDVDEYVNIPLETTPTFPEKTDIWVTTEATGANVPVSAVMDFILIK